MQAVCNPKVMDELTLVHTVHVRSTLLIDKSKYFLLPSWTWGPSVPLDLALGSTFPIYSHLAVCSSSFNMSWNLKPHNNAKWVISIWMFYFWLWRRGIKNRHHKLLCCPHDNRAVANRVWYGQEKMCIRDKSHIHIIETGLHSTCMLTTVGKSRALPGTLSLWHSQTSSAPSHSRKGMKR